MTPPWLASPRCRKQRLLETPIRNPSLPVLVAELEKGQPKSFAAGIDVIYADVLDSARKTLGPIPHHTHALVFLVEYTRDPTPSEPGTDWFTDSQAQRAGLLAANTAILLSSYIRLLGYEARAHTVTSSDVDLNKLAVAAGLAHVTADGDAIENPYVGRRFGLAAVTTTLALAPDLPLADAEFRRPPAQSRTFMVARQGHRQECLQQRAL